MPGRPCESRPAEFVGAAPAVDRLTIWLVVLAVAVLASAQLVAMVASETPGDLLALDVAAVVVGLAGLPLMLRRPVAGALVLSLLAGLSPAATPAATVASFHAAQRCRFRVALGVALVGAAVHAIRGWWRPVDGLPYGWWLLLVVVAYATLVGWGSFAQARRALLATLRERARRAETEAEDRVREARAAERNRIAREMHDVLAHRLSLLATYAGALEYRPDASPARLSAAAGVVRAGVHEALADLREVIGLLRDEDAEDAGPSVTRPQPTLVDLPRLVDESRNVGTRVELASSGDLAGLPMATGRAAYRIIQEALTNARRHAPGHPVRVGVHGEPGVHVDIEVRNPVDDLSGGSGDGAGTGLVGLAERVELLEGELTWGRSSDGFRLHARLPWPA